MAAQSAGMMQVLLAHPGTQHSRHLARELAARGLLGEFWTGLGFSVDSLAGRAARAASNLPGLHGLASRVLTGVPAGRLHTTPMIELRALGRLRRAESADVIHERNATFQRAIPDSALDAADAVIGFDTSSWILAERLAVRGQPLLLDRTIAHPAAHARIMGEVAARYPEWGAAVETRSPTQLAAEQSEHDLAHRIVVGSPFVARTLAESGVDPAKIIVNPYGVDWERFAAPACIPAGARPRRFLFAGSLIARKGVPWLLAAWQALGTRHAELWLAGYASEPIRRLIPDLPGLHLLGQVAHHNMPALYAQCDVFVLPTFFEGFSLVVLEALAAGLPVITTPNSGAETVLARPGLGRIVPPGDTDALVAALRAGIEQPPVRAEVLAVAQPLRTEFSWNAYGERWARLLEETV